MSQLSKKEVNDFAKKLYKAVKLMGDVTIMLEGLTNEIAREKYNEETLQEIALKYKSISEKNEIDYMPMNMHDSIYQNMDDFMNKIEEVLENEE